MRLSIATALSVRRANLFFCGAFLTSDDHAGSRGAYFAEWAAAEWAVRWEVAAARIPMNSPAIFSNIETYARDPELLSSLQREISSSPFGPWRDWLFGGGIFGTRAARPVIYFDVRRRNALLHVQGQRETRDHAHCKYKYEGCGHAHAGHANAHRGNHLVILCSMRACTERGRGKGGA